MSDFFAGVYGAKFPEVVMNSGPLPPPNGLPAPLHDTADARINYNSTLLGNLEPYAYGEPGYLSSQVSYVNQPHRIQKLVPVLRLPTPHVNSITSFELSHPIDDSDIAFVMRLDRASTVCTSLSSRAANRQFSSVMDPYINLCTLNYLLAGIQLSYVSANPDKSKWFDLLHDLDKEHFLAPGHEISLNDLRHIIRDLIRPFGVVRGSERQGGQDEVGNSPATWPVNFVANLVLDGKERNVVNIWHFHDISAGDDLVLRLKPMPIPNDGQGYTLNHYYKKFVQQNFQGCNRGAALQPTHVWQLVPDVFTMDLDPETPDPDMILPPGLPMPAGYCWQELGFWHIGRTQVMFRKYAEQEYYFNDMANQLKVNHLDMTFEPTWTKVPGEAYGPHRGIVDRYRPAPAAGPALPPGAPLPLVIVRHAGDDVYAGMRAEFDAPAAKRVRWAPELQLEHLGQILDEPMPTLSSARPPRDDPPRLAALNDLFAAPAPRPRQAASLARAEVDDLFAAPRPRQPSLARAEVDGLFAAPRPRQPAPLPPRPAASQPIAAPDPDPRLMDIGVLEEPPPLPPKPRSGLFETILSAPGRKKPAARKAAAAAAAAEGPPDAPDAAPAPP
jgi:hypothetical protein